MNIYISPELLFFSGFVISGIFITIILIIIRTRSKYINQLQALGEKEKLYDKIFNIIPCGITITDNNGRIIDVNEASVRLLGLSREEQLSRKLDSSLWNIIQADGTRIPDDQYPGIRAMKEDRTINDTEMGIVTSAGTRWVQAGATPVKSRSFGVVVVYVDITDRKNAEEYLHNVNSSLVNQVDEEVVRRLKSEAKYEFLFQVIPDAIIVYGFNDDGTPGQFLEINEAAEGLLGVGLKDTFSQDGSLLNPFRNQNRKKLIGNLYEKGEIQFEEDIITPEGDRKEIFARTRLIEFDELPMAVTVINDLTELHRLQREKEIQQAMLIQQSKMAEMGNMLGVIAHQWAQPLNGIALISEDIADAFEYGELNSEVMKKGVKEILDLVEFLSETIHDFRNFFKPGLVRDNFSVIGSIENVYSMMQSQFRSSGINVQIIGDSDIKVNGFKSEFKHVILNLLINARDVIFERKINSPEIVINVEQQIDDVVITFVDNAGGIADHEKKDNIFEPFVSTKGENGTGIGLSLSREILKKMDASISVENVNQGACFTIHFPVETILEQVSISDSKIENQV